MNIPNILTIARLLLVPLIVWLILERQWAFAFAAFVAAGVTDALDGVLARRSGTVSELGKILDPVADKTLLVSIYITLGLQGFLPSWIVITVVSRDILIVGAFLLSSLIGAQFNIDPLRVSKINTAAQIVLAAVVLCDQALSWGLADLEAAIIDWMTIVVAITTVLSGALYLISWVRSMATETKE